MAQPVEESTGVVVVGAGVAGLTVANLLTQAGIPCVVLERNARAYVEQRQRAGTVEPRAVRIFENAGLADRVLSGPPHKGIIEFRVDGQSRLLHEVRESGVPPARLCTQQVLVRNLIATFLEDGGDLRFEAADIAVADLAGRSPTVGYRDVSGVWHEVSGQAIAGCDGDRGVTRASIPSGVLTTHALDYGIGWLSVLAEIPPAPNVLMGVSDDGFVAQFSRGPAISRFYLECGPADQPADWPDDRIWAQLRHRLGDERLGPAPISERDVFALRASVHEPMRYGRLFLLGDAAHVISPMAAKGMNLAIGDAAEFVRVFTAYTQTGREEELDAYSESCLRRVWNFQEFSAWMTEMVHDSGRAERAGSFRRGLARARLDRLLTSPPAVAAFSDLMGGLS